MFQSGTSRQVTSHPGKSLPPQSHPAISIRIISLSAVREHEGHVLWLPLYYNLHIQMVIFGQKLFLEENSEILLFAI